MQIDGFFQRQTLARSVFAGLLLSFSLTGQAQEPEPAVVTGEAIPEDYYRAELVILERRIDPSAVNEHMTGRKVEPTANTEAVLESLAQDGTVETTLALVPTSELSLNTAAQRLERSGQYRVLMNAGWYQAFPPGYEGEPLRVAIGDWLERAGVREIEGTITIDRQRYLHVDVHLNHWQYDESVGLQEMAEPNSEETLAGSEETLTTGEETAATNTAGALQTTDVNGIQPGFTGAPLELLTWIRETRRMRSEEIHFLDSPTIGVLVFFKKIEAAE